MNKLEMSASELRSPFAFHKNLNCLFPARHYVATAGQSSTEPVDTDSDGIPDYVEDADGDNDPADVTALTETDPADPETEDGTADSFNIVYDDFDLDGDGLPGAAERTLATDPLVEDNPLAGASLAIPSTVSGLVTIPLPIPPSAGDAMYIAFTVNGQHTVATVHEVDGNWCAEWDTAFLLNGDYYVALEVEAGGQSRSATCPGKLVTVQNAIWFPDSSLTVSDELNINAQTIFANGTWTMDIYDDQENLFDSLEGDVDENGFCDYPDTSQQGVSLSLLDESGNPLPSEFYTIVITTHAPAAAEGEGGGSATATIRPYVERKWNNYRPGRWVVAYQRIWDRDSEGHNNQRKIMNTMVEAVYANGTYELYGEAVIGTPVRAKNYQVLELRYSSAWDKFVGWIGTSQENLDVRNLFYFGHCDHTLNGGNLGGTPDPAISTDAVRLQGRLKNNNSPGWDVGPGNKHPYRFVFICGCSSAKTDLPLTFGIPKEKLSRAEWDKKYKLPSRAFLGFDGDIPTKVGIAGQPSDTMNAALKKFLEVFWKSWVDPDPVTKQKRTLEEAVNEAKKAANSVTKGPSEWAYPIKPQIYGCKDLLFDEK